MNWVFGLIMAIIAAAAVGRCIRGYYMNEPEDISAWLIAAISFGLALHIWAHLLGVWRH